VAAARVAARPSVGLTGGYIVGVADCTGAVWAVFVALAARFERFLVFIQLVRALI